MSSIGSCTLPLGPHLVVLFGEGMEPLGWGVLQEIGHWGCTLKFYTLIQALVLSFHNPTVQCDQPAFPVLQQGLRHHNGLYDLWDCKCLIHSPTPSFQRCIASSFSILVAHCHVYLQPLTGPMKVLDFFQWHLSIAPAQTSLIISSSKRPKHLLYISIWIPSNTSIYHNLQRAIPLLSLFLQ